MSFDLEPKRDPHGECALEIKRLTTALVEAGKDKSKLIEALQCGEVSLRWATEILLKVARTGSQLADIQCAIDDLNKMKQTLESTKTQENTDG